MSNPPSIPPAGEVHVWLVSIDPTGADSAECDALLSRNEKARAARFHFESDRARYLLAHAGLRRILSSCTGTSPAELAITSEAGKKPLLTGCHARLRFNLSHSGDTALVAIADGIDVGVDVERIRPGMDFDGIAQHFFTPAEAAAVGAAAPAEKPGIFFRLWTRKEAALKLSGRGLGGLAREAIDGWVSDLPAAPGYAAAVATSVAPAGVVTRWLQPPL